MSGFGDDHPDDAYSPARAAPEQVARRLHELRRGAGRELVDWEALTDEQRTQLTVIVAALLAWLRREGST